MKKICWICGGSGAYTGLRGIRDMAGIDLTVLTTTFDSGGAQGVILAGDPTAIALADPMKCLVALAGDEVTARLYRHRFEGNKGNGLADHRQTVGNVIWYGLLRMGMSPRDAIAYMREHLRVKSCHRVEPVALDRANICVKLANGQEIKGEARIDVPAHDGSVPIVDAWLEPDVETTAYAFKAVIEADLIVIGPGDIYSSLVPCLLPRGIKDALSATRARIVYVVNLMNKYGETTDFTACDFVSVIERYAGRHMGVVVGSSKLPDESILDRYRGEKAGPVVMSDLKWANGDGREVVACDLLDATDGIVRHDSARLASLVASLAGVTISPEASAAA